MSNTKKSTQFLYDLETYIRDLERESHCQIRGIAGPLYQLQQKHMVKRLKKIAKEISTGVAYRF